MNFNNTYAGQLLAPVFCMLASFGPGALLAGQENGSDHSIDEIVVVANKTERSVREIAANVTVVSRDELDNLLAVSAADVFRYAPGIGYGVLDFYVLQRFDSGLALRAGLMNVTDRTYWNRADVRGLGPTDPVLPYLAQPGRNVSLSINYDWQ